MFAVPCPKTQQQDLGEWSSIQLTKAFLEEGWDTFFFEDNINVCKPFSRESFLRKTN